MKTKNPRSKARTSRSTTKGRLKSLNKRWSLLGVAVFAVLIVGAVVIWPRVYSSDSHDFSYTFAPPTPESMRSRTRMIYSNGSKLFLADSEGKSKKNLQLPTYNGRAVSNDGTHIAYITDKGDLAIMNVDGGDQKTIYQTKDNVSVRRVVAWASDNKYILYEWEHRKSPPSDLDPAAPWCVKGDCVDATGYIVISKDGSQSQTFKPQTDYEKWITQFGRSNGSNKFYDLQSKKIATLEPAIITTGQSASVSPNGTYRAIGIPKHSDIHSLFACDYYEVLPDGRKGKLLVSTHYDCSRIFWKDDHSFFFIKDTGPVPLEYALTSLTTSYQPTAIAVYDMATSREDELLRSSDTTKDYFTLLGANGSHLIFEREYVKESMLSVARPSSLESIAATTKQTKVIDTPSNYPSLFDWIK